MYKYTTFVEYSSVFETPQNNNNIIEIIKGVNFEFACKVLSIFGYYDKNYDKNMISEFLIRKGAKEKALLGEGTHIITRHAVLVAWKYFLAHYDICMQTHGDEEVQIEKILRLILIINESDIKEDLSVSPEEINLFFSANAYFNYRDSTWNMSVRSYFLFLKNKINKSNINIDPWNREFELQHEGISIEKYVYLTYLISTYMEDRNTNRTQDEKALTLSDWYINPKTIPGVSLLTKRELRVLLNILSFSRVEGQKWGEDNISKPERMDLFIKKPFIKINEDCYIPIEQKIVGELLFYSLIQRICNCNDDREKYMTAIGNIFEEYIDYICNETCLFSRGYYVPIREFKYNSGKRSPDFMLLNRNTTDTVMVIEAKSTKIFNSVNNYLDLDENCFERTREKTYYRPLNQAMKAITDIVENNYSTDITGEKVYYFVTVTMTNLPFKLTGENIPIGKYMNLKIGGYISINIEELELFLRVLICPKANPFGWYIEKYMGNHSHDSFKNFINKFDKSDSGPIFKLFDEITYKANGYIGTLR